MERAGSYALVYGAPEQQCRIRPYQQEKETAQQRAIPLLPICSFLVMLKCKYDAGLLITLSYYVYVELASVLCKCKFLMCVCVSSCHRTPIKHGLSVEIIRKMLHLNIATNEPQIISVQHPYNQQHSAHLCTPVCLHIPHGEVSIFTLFLFISAFVCFVSCRIVDLV